MWAQHNHPHLRSFSPSTPMKTIRKSPRPVSKSTSASALHTMAAVANSPGLPTRLSYYNDDDADMSTIPDPRSRALVLGNENGPLSPSHHPDLNNEVATLSNKLISAINHQTNLDDTLSATRQELEASQERIKILERENVEHAELLSRGILIRKSVTELEKSKLNAILADERRQRAEVEKDKKRMDEELENLTAALFEEANKMVITAREEAKKERDIVQRRNDQLKAQLADTEGLLKSQQEQLTELKQVMEHLTEERDDQTNPTAPSTPGLSKYDSKVGFQDTEIMRPASAPETVTPSYPTSFIHLLHTVLRTDLSSFDDFQSLLRMSKNVPTGSRVSSGTYGSIGLGLGLGGYVPPSTQAPTNGSTTSLSTAGTLGSSPATPTTPASTVSTVSNHGPNSLTPLKDTKFYKRALAEDIEPTLRLDTAPGLSWLARRNMLNAVCEGTLVVEPMPAATKSYAFPCSLCGEIRKGPSHTRSHRFRTSESESAQRYPLCKYCLGRVRSTCDFLGFLRILKEGHWRCEDEEAEKAAWEESVRLREQMFWCRIGGGVVPAHHNHAEPRMSEDGRREQERKLSEELEQTGEIQPKDITPLTEHPIDAFKSASTKRTSQIAVKDGRAGDIIEEAQDDSAEPSSAGIAVEEVGVVGLAMSAVSFDVPMEHDVTRDSMQSTAPLEVPCPSPNQGGKGGGTRLSVTIPGAFE